MEFPEGRGGPSCELILENPEGMGGHRKNPFRVCVCVCGVSGECILVFKR